MRKVFAVVIAVAATAVVFDLTNVLPAATTTTMAPVASPTASTTLAPVTSLPHPGFSMTGGALPDGTEFVVNAAPAIPDAPRGIDPGMIVIDIDGEPAAVGSIQMSFSTWTDSLYDRGVYRFSAGGHFVQIAFYDHVLDELGPDAEEIIRSSIRGSLGMGYPVLEVDTPFRWAGDEEVSAQMGVMFAGFEVRRGCGDLAVACSETRAVQVIPLDRLYGPAPQWNDATVTIHSPAPRPEDDSYYLDPGPLSPRYGADLMWTGEEMIVWGGTDGTGRPYLADGAAFDSGTGLWRLLPESPVPSGSTNRGVWAGDRMVVVSPKNTVAYAPEEDDWEVLGEGRDPGWSQGRMVVIDSHVYLWTDRIHVFDLERGGWSILPDPPFEVGPEEWQKGLHVFKGHLLAVGESDSCGLFGASAWHGGEWRMVSLADWHCSRQVATTGDRVVFWNEDESVYAIWIDGVHWSFAGLPGHGMGGMEGAGGALALDETQLLVPQFGEGAILDAATWTRVELPGWGTEREMVWTGEEVLMWGVPMCCLEDGASIDAWRWMPPP